MWYFFYKLFQWVGCCCRLWFLWMFIKKLILHQYFFDKWKFPQIFFWIQFTLSFNHFGLNFTSFVKFFYQNFQHNLSLVQLFLYIYFYHINYIFIIEVTYFNKCKKPHILKRLQFTYTPLPYTNVNIDWYTF
jgi:hypothetical protein